MKRWLIGLLLALVPIAGYAQFNGCSYGFCSKAGTATPFSLTATASAVDTSTQTTYNFGTLSFGAANVTRVIAIETGARISSGTQFVSSASIGGVAATFAVRQLETTGQNATEIWYAAVPTGTTGNVSVTYAGPNARAAVQVYAIVAPSSNAPTSTGANTGTNPSASVTIPSGGAAIGIAYWQNGGPGTPTGSPAGFTNLDLNSNINGTQQVSAIHSNAGALTGAQTLGMTLAGAGLVSGVFAAWGP